MAYTPIDYNPVLSNYGGREWRQHELSHITSLGIEPDVAAELVMLRARTGHMLVGRILRGLLAGIDRAEVDEVLARNADGFEKYLEMRREGASHDDALDAALKVHIHRFGDSEVLMDFNPVLHTGERVVRSTCYCGEVQVTTQRRNWSGD